MYTKPDFIEVKVDMAAVFQSSCPGDYAGYYQWTGEGCQDQWIKGLLTGGTAAWQCYSSLNK